MSKKLLEVNDILVNFGGVTALNKVNLHVSEGEIAAFAARGLVGFVENTQIERLSRFQCRADHLRRLVGGEDDFRAGERSVEKVTDADHIGGDLEVEVGLRRGN